MISSYCSCFGTFLNCLIGEDSDRECSPATAALQLRAMFEALLTIEYLTEAKRQNGPTCYRISVPSSTSSKTGSICRRIQTPPEGRELREFIVNSPYSGELKTSD